MGWLDTFDKAQSGKFIPVGKQPQAPWDTKISNEVIYQDNRTDAERLKSKQIADDINSSIVPINKQPLVYLADPLKIVGDFVEGFRPNRNIFPTSKEDAHNIALSKHFGGKGDVPTNEERGWLDYAPMAALNVGLGAAFAPESNFKSILNESINPLAIQENSAVPNLTPEARVELQAVEEATARRQLIRDQQRRAISLMPPGNRTIISNFADNSNKFSDFYQKALDYGLHYGELDKVHNLVVNTLRDNNLSYSEFNRIGETLNNGSTLNSYTRENFNRAAEAVHDAIINDYPELARDFTNYRNTRVSSSPFEPLVEEVKNKSKLTKNQALSKVDELGKYKIENMTDEEFANTVIRPDGSIVESPSSSTLNNITYNVQNKSLILKDADALPREEYIKIFNDNIDYLNELIAKKHNTSGIDYSVTGLSDDGHYLRFKHPEQKNIRQITEEEGEYFIDIPEGESAWNVVLNPGKWKGEVENIPNSDYYKSIPGISMRNNVNSVFSDLTPRRGTGTYNALNEYLKYLELGRVKSGFNDQSIYSRPLWEKAINTKKAVGHYSDAGTVHGVFKTLVPTAGIAGAMASNKEMKHGGWLSKYEQGGIIEDDRGQWAHPGEITKINSNNITMQGVNYPVLGISDTGDQQMMYPGEEYKFDGKSVTEFPMAQSGKTLLPKYQNRGWLDTFQNWGNIPVNIRIKLKQ